MNGGLVGQTWIYTSHSSCWTRQPKGTRRRQRGLAALEGIALLDLTDDVTELAGQLVGRGGLPVESRVDAFHVSIATVHGMDYLLSWNCKHIANAGLRGKIETICRSAGFEPPVICTPLELIKG